MPEKLYQAMAHAFQAEGTEVLFTLMGDANMHWAIAMEQLGVRTIHVRHEHSACSMAMSYANATGAVGVAAVTCGPGLTQLSTALATAVRARIPLVVFAGEVPLGAAWHNQGIDQGPIVTATGARYTQIHTVTRALQQITEAFMAARNHRVPVVVGVPLDVQQQLTIEGQVYRTSIDTLLPAGRIMPDPYQVKDIAEQIRASHRIVVLAGRGAQRAGAALQCVALADTCGAMLATTLPVRGLFHDHPFNLGVAGGFSTNVAKETFGEADLLLAVGASLAYHTADGGRLYPNAKVIQIDVAPTGINQGRVAADIFLCADAAAGIDAILEVLRVEPSTSGGWRSAELQERLRTEPADTEIFPAQEGRLDPRDAVAVLDRILPKSWEMVNGSGHSSYFSAQMFGRKAENFHTIREFGAIGNGLSYAMGVAVARPDVPVVLLDGDGGILMHIQELETIRRHGLNVLICVLNDGGFGSEFHKLRADGVDDRGAIFGHGDLGAVARGFGVEGRVINSLDGFEQAFSAYLEEPKAALWDIHVSDLVTSPVIRQAHPKKQ